MILKQQHSQTVRELTKLIRSTRSSMGMAEAEADLEAIKQILFDDGNTSFEQLYIVCSVASQDSFCSEDSDVLYNVADDELNGELEDDSEIGQIAVRLVNSRPEKSLHELSQLELPKAIAIIAKIGLFNPSFVGRMVEKLETAHENPEMIGD